LNGELSGNLPPPEHFVNPLGIVPEFSFQIRALLTTGESPPEKSFGQAIDMLNLLDPKSFFVEFPSQIFHSTAIYKKERSEWKSIAFTGIPILSEQNAFSNCFYVSGGE
jgi:hypothetical protein